MLFPQAERAAVLLDRVREFMTEEVCPLEHRYCEQSSGENRYRTLAIVQELKTKAKAASLWNLFLPGNHGAGLTNLEYAPLAEEMGRVQWASEVFNCSTPDTGNMEILLMFGLPEQKKQWLEPLLAGEIRSAFSMTEPAVASSDATNIQCEIRQDEANTSSTAANGSPRVP
jgi:acyl-CoA dehydrogenase